MNETVTTAYKIKKGINFKKFKTQYNFDRLPESISGNSKILFKIVKVDFDSDPSKLVLDILNDPKYLKFLDAQGIKLSDEFKYETIYDEDGKEKNSLIITDYVKEFCTTWRVEFEYCDRILEFTTGNMSFPYAFISKRILDKFCSEQIKDLIEDKIIEEVEYSNEG